MSISDKKQDQNPQPPAWIECLSCGFRPGVSQHRRDHRPMFPVIDESGSYTVCGLCVISLLARVGDENATLLLNTSVVGVMLR
jgi:hypothetical protein